MRPSAIIAAPCKSCPTRGKSGTIWDSRSPPEKQYAEAVTNFEASLKLKPTAASAHNNLATVLFIEGRYDEAAKHFRAALETTPDNPQIWANLGDTLLRLNAPADAVKCYRQALELNPDDSKTKAKLKSLGTQ